MAGHSKIDLEELARKRRVRSLHKWFAALQRNVNKPVLIEAENTPKYAETRT